MSATLGMIGEGVKRQDVNGNVDLIGKGQMRSPPSRGLNLSPTRGNTQAHPLVTRSTAYRTPLVVLVLDRLPSMLSPKTKRRKIIELMPDANHPYFEVPPSALSSLHRRRKGRGRAGVRRKKSLWKASLETNFRRKIIAHCRRLLQQR